MAAAAASNLKNVTLELGGKSPNIVFDDADLDQATPWPVPWNHGQACCAGSRVYVQAGIYDEFLRRFTRRRRRSPQQQYGRIMGYIESGKKDGATGFFIEPTIFTNTTEDMQIVKEEIFGPVGVIIKPLPCPSSRVRLTPPSCALSSQRRH
ncbi:Aldehyde/histidinol dehydrogenase [Mycena olivaceomarginata]|nr:Aldehyde/histidinol dehydrogenase [Mycena olivaceomarginata]